MSERLYIGCDPDMHTLPIVVCNDQLQIRSIHLIRVSDKKRDQEAVISMTAQIGMRAVGSTGFFFHGWAVEAQEIMLERGDGRGTQNPRNILHLGHVAGAVLAFFGGCFPEVSQRRFPLPIQWKGNVPKIVHHKRILHAAGIAHDNIGTAGGQDPYCYIINPDQAWFGDNDKPNKGDWKHICDSLGLAQWVAKEHKAEMLKQKHLAEARGATARGT